MVPVIHVMWSLACTLLAITCSKATTKTLEQGLKYVKS